MAVNTAVAFTPALRRDHPPRLRHYRFTEEDLDFIINHDIKYRMGISPAMGSTKQPSGRDLGSRVKLLAVPGEAVAPR
ncbi:MAG: hypothetical protein ACREXS_10085 [Gammaproteobacteria bacterium]